MEQISIKSSHYDPSITSNSDLLSNLSKSKSAIYPIKSSLINNTTILSKNKAPKRANSEFNFASHDINLFFKLLITDKHLNFTLICKTSANHSWKNLRLNGGIKN
jgi:hypothetical protein